METPRFNLWEALGRIESSKENHPGNEKAGQLLSALSDQTYWGGQEISLEADDGWVVRVFSCYDRDTGAGEVEIVLRVPQQGCYRRGGPNPIVLELPHSLLAGGVVIKPTGSKLSVVKPEEFFVHVTCDDENEWVGIATRDGKDVSETFGWCPKETPPGYSGVLGAIAEARRLISDQGHAAVVVGRDVNDAPWA